MLYPPHRVDFGLAILGRGLWYCLSADEPAARRAVAQQWGPQACAIPFLSVRSAFDAALTALALAPGDEVLLSAITIDDMARLVTAHGHVAVPVDVDPAMLAPSLADLEAACTPRTRAVVVAHLFGGRLDLTALCAWAHARGLVVVEDAAQAVGDGTYSGHPQADVSLFSFGTIKTASALGGAIACVRSPALHQRMTAIQAQWPLQPAGQFARKLLKSSLFILLQSALCYAAVHAVCVLARTTAGAFGRTMSRGFGGLDAAALLVALRQRPAVPLLRLLHHRLGHISVARVAKRAAWGTQLHRALPTWATPGYLQADHTHWLVPVVVPAPDALRAALQLAGFDAFGASNVVALGGTQATALMAGLVFVPAYPELPLHRLRQLTAIVRAHVAPEDPC